MLALATCAMRATFAARPVLLHARRLALALWLTRLRVHLLFLLLHVAGMLLRVADRLRAGASVTPARG